MDALYLEGPFETANVKTGANDEVAQQSKPLLGSLVKPPARIGLDLAQFQDATSINRRLGRFHPEAPLGGTRRLSGRIPARTPG